MHLLCSRDAQWSPVEQVLVERRLLVGVLPVSEVSQLLERQRDVPREQFRRRELLPQEERDRGIVSGSRPERLRAPSTPGRLC